MPIPTVSRGPYRINDAVTVDNQTDVSITALVNGRFALAWQSNTANTGNDDIRFSIRKANGDAVSTAFNDEPLATVGTYDETRPAVAALADGRSVYVWEEAGAPGSVGGEIDTFALIRNADGAVFKSRFVLSTQGIGSADDQNLPEVIGLANGNFMVAWMDDAAAKFLKIRVYDIAGNQIGGENTISTAAMTANVSNNPVMTLLGNGNVVATWNEGIAGAEQQRFAILSENGALLKVDTDVNPEDAVVEGGDGSGQAIALANGNFVIIVERDADANDIQGRLFDSTGTALGGRFDISTGAANGSPRATALADGRFMVVYDNGSDLFGQMMFADGTKDGARFTVSSATAFQGDAEIATLADGRVVVSYEDNSGGTTDIFAAIYDPRQSGLNGSASTFGDDWVGTAFDDTVYLGLGNDTTLGGAGNDIIYGEAGNDSLLGGTGQDSMIGGSGNDTMFGEGDNDVMSGELGLDLMIGGAGSDAIYGGGGNDTISGEGDLDGLYGEDGNDLIFGGAGGDYIYGGAGDDAVFGEADADIIEGNAGIDNLNGGAGNDTIYGGAARDFIFGNAGNDELYGGADDDVFDLRGDVLAGEFDTIVDFQDFQNGAVTNDFIALPVAFQFTAVIYTPVAGITQIFIPLGGGTSYLVNVTGTSPANILDNIIWA